MIALQAIGTCFWRGFLSAFFSDLQLSVPINPLPCSSQGIFVGFAFSREGFLELILIRWKIMSLASRFVTRQAILRNPGSIFLSLKGFAANEAVFVFHAVFYLSVPLS